MITLGHFGLTSGSLLGSLWDHFGVTSGSLWGHVGITLGLKINGGHLNTNLSTFASDREVIHSTGTHLKGDLNGGLARSTFSPSAQAFSFGAAKLARPQRSHSSCVAQALAFGLCMEALTELADEKSHVVLRAPHEEFLRLRLVLQRPNTHGAQR